MLEDERENYDAYVAMGEVQLYEEEDEGSSESIQFSQ